MHHISFQCPDSGWPVIVEFDGDKNVAGTCRAWPARMDEADGWDQSADGKTWTQDWLAGFEGRRFANGLLLDEALKRAGVPSDDLFGFAWEEEA